LELNSEPFFCHIHEIGQNGGLKAKTRHLAGLAGKDGQFVSFSNLKASIE
jgi:hypothetical protein